MTTQSERAAALGLPIHPPKKEIFDLTNRTNTDSRQLVRTVDEYRVESFGLYMARPIKRHHKLAYIQSWILPELGIRVTDWDRHPGVERDLDFYVDIIHADVAPELWVTTDFYLDISVNHHQNAKILDIDEFLTAVRADLLTEATAQRAMETTYAALDGIVKHGYDLPAWLAREHNIELTWRPASD